MSKELEVTGTHVQHQPGDDLGRCISNAILEWERRNPGVRVTKIQAEHNRDVMAPYLYVQATTERDAHHCAWCNSPVDCGPITEVSNDPET